MTVMFIDLGYERFVNLFIHRFDTQKILVIFCSYVIVEGDMYRNCYWEIWHFCFFFFFFFSCSTRFMGMLIKLNETFMFVKNRGGHMHSLLFAISGGFVNKIFF